MQVVDGDHGANTKQLTPIKVGWKEARQKKHQDYMAQTGTISLLMETPLIPNEA
jgi:hypothetical protein